MVQPHDASAALPILSRYRQRGWLSAMAVVTISVVTALPAWSGITSDNVPETAPQVAATVPGGAQPAPSSGSSTAVAVIKPADAKPQVSSEQQRQFMMILLMNSAGPVRPFGGLGR